MIEYEAVHQDADTYLEDIEDDTGVHITSDPTDDEVESLLQTTDLPVDIVPAKSSRRMVISMTVLFIFIIEVSDLIMSPSTQQIMEDIICRQYYSSHALRVPRVQDHSCKNTEVQKTLAMVRSWSTSSEMLVPLLVQIPYGIVADKYGRRPVLFLSLFGCLISQTWAMIVLLFPDTFSILTMLYGNLAYFIGGGGQMVGAMIWTMLADVIPVTERTNMVYRLNAMVPLVSIAVNPLTALLLSLDPWIAMWIGYGTLVIGVFSSLLIPETLSLRQIVDSKRHDEQFLPQSQGSTKLPGKKALVRRAWFSVTNGMSDVWHFVFASKSIMVLIFAHSLYFVIDMSFSLVLLQYITRRFDWEWSTATYISTVRSLTFVVLLLVILPLASSFLEKRRGFDPVTRDLHLARISIVITAIGSLITALAAGPWLFIASLIITSLGNGYGSLGRALLNAVVESHTVATLNTTISTMETLMGLVGAPVLGWLLSRGMELGGAWTGLPYLVTAVLAVVAVVATFAFRIPAGYRPGDVELRELSNRARATRNQHNN